jgi:hypothetical protein
MISFRINNNPFNVFFRIKQTVNNERVTYIHPSIKPIKCRSPYTIQDTSCTRIPAQFIPFSFRRTGHRFL